MSKHRQQDWNRSSGVDTFANLLVIGAGFLVIVLGSLAASREDSSQGLQVAQRPANVGIVVTAKRPGRDYS